MMRVLVSILLCSALIAPMQRSSGQDADAFRVSLTVQDKPAADALRILFEKAGTKYRISPDAQSGAARIMTVSISNCTLPVALRSILLPVQLTYRVEDDVYVILDTRPERPRVGVVFPPSDPLGIRPIKVDIVDRPLSEALETMFKAADVKYKIEPSIPAKSLARKVSVHVEGRSLRLVLSQLFEVIKTDDEHLVGKPAGDGYVIMPLQGSPPEGSMPNPKVQVKINSVPLIDALRMLFQKGEVNYLLIATPEMDKPVSLPDEPMGMAVAIRRLLAQNPKLKDLPLTYDHGFARIDRGIPAALAGDDARVYASIRNVDARYVISEMLGALTRNYDIDPRLKGNVTCELKGEDVMNSLNKVLAAAKTIGPLRLKVDDDGIHHVVFGGGSDKKR